MAEGGATEARGGWKDAAWYILRWRLDPTGSAGTASFMQLYTLASSWLDAILLFYPYTFHCVKAIHMFPGRGINDIGYNKSNNFGGGSNGYQLS